MVLGGKDHVDCLCWRAKDVEDPKLMKGMIKEKYTVQVYISTL